MSAAKQQLPAVHHLVAAFKQQSKATGLDQVCEAVLDGNGRYVSNLWQALLE